MHRPAEQASELLALFVGWVGFTPLCRFVPNVVSLNHFAFTLIKYLCIQGANLLRENLMLRINI